MKKRWIKCCVIAACLAIALVAYAAGSRITLDSSKPAADQIELFKEWYKQLDYLEQAEWDLAFAELTDPWSATYMMQESSVSEETEQMVWIPKTGAKYHSKSTCSNMKNPRHVTLSDAISRGYGKCSKCWGK
jgi:hypothetical protein